MDRVNRSPQFSEQLERLLAERRLNRGDAAKACGLSRPVFTRLIQGLQWPQPEQLAAIFKLAETEAQKRDLEFALHGDCSVAAGMSRFQAVEESASPYLTLRVPREHAAVAEDVLALLVTDATARTAFEAMVPAFLRKHGVEFDAAHESKSKLSTPTESMRYVIPKSRSKRSA